VPLCPPQIQHDLTGSNPGRRSGSDELCDSRWESNAGDERGVHTSVSERLWGRVVAYLQLQCDLHDSTLSLLLQKHDLNALSPARTSMKRSHRCYHHCQQMIRCH
jgi:hypothetical protein